MRNHRRIQRRRRLACACVCVVAGLGAAPARGSVGQDSSRGPLVEIDDPFTRGVVQRALTGAERRLASERCGSIVSQFADVRGGELTEQLSALGLDLARYLRTLVFRDAGADVRCRHELTFAFTTPLGRLVFVCGRRFERLWREAPARADAVIIHEVLHTLGLGENPPPSEVITQRILKLCERVP
jgi:hypothetical protein